MPVFGPERKAMADLYLKLLRPRLLKDGDDTLEPQPGFKSGREAFILNKFGNAMSGSKISNRISAIAPKLNPKLKTRLNVAMLRKALVSSIDHVLHQPSMPRPWLLRCLIM